MVSHAMGMEKVPNPWSLDSSQSAAFAFHQTAYKERLEEVKLGLRVIEKLREHKPRTRHQPNRSSGGHGMFSLGFIHPFSEKDSSHRRHRDSASQCHDDGNDADTENGKGKGRQRPVVSRSSSQLHDAIPDPPGLEDSTDLTPSHEQHDLLSRRHAVDQHVPQHGEPNPAILAARVIKSAVLHDARNIKGDDDDLTDLRFSVNSAHEAKV